MYISVLARRVSNVGPGKIRRHQKVTLRSRSNLVTGCHAIEHVSNGSEAIHPVWTSAAAKIQTVLR
jgi:hypothetical protein